MKLPALKILKLSSRAGILATAGVVVLVLGGSSAYAAHSNALPGSTLYPLKQLWEKGQVVLSFSPASKAETQVNIAQDRVKAAQATVSQTPAATNGSNAIDALQQAQQHLQQALTHASNVSDPSQRKEIEKKISDTAAEAEAEAQHESESESTNSTDKQDLQNTSDQIKQVRDQASSDD